MMLPLQERRALADAAVAHGHWMIRADNDGVSPNKQSGGFRWPEAGVHSLSRLYEGIQTSCHT
jgi:hypothetical protein